MGEFNIYGEMLDFQNFIKLFVDTGIRVEFDKNYPPQYEKYNP